MILLIDNYDSFSYNLYQLLASFSEPVKVVRNDKITIEEARELSPTAIFLSPGPGKPCDAGICIPLIQQLYKEFPIFGVCLGEQALGEAFGATVTYAPTLMHGKVSEILLDETSFVFKGLGKTIMAGRYHSLAVDPATVPEELRITATTRDGIVMALEHRDYPVVGLQFHPESILTPQGREIVDNYLQNIRRNKK